MTHPTDTGEELREAIAKDICRVAEQHGGPPWEYLVSQKSEMLVLYREQAEAAMSRARSTTGAEVRPLEEWHEDMGPQLWWKQPVDEPPYCGTPIDLNWPGYHTHFTPILVPESLLASQSPTPAHPMTHTTRGEEGRG